MPKGVVRRYGVIALTLVVGLISVLLLLFGQEDAARWLVGGYSLAVAAGYTVRMARQLARGHFGVDILAVTTILATVLVGEVVASLIVVLMLAGGEALEDYASC